MNKLMGFFELRHLSIPTVPWKEFSKDAVLEKQYLWTIRTAVNGGNDLNLPRAVGVTADEAIQKGSEFLDQLGHKGRVIYYPYFIAEKSGVIEINRDYTVIEAVEKDLWNFVTYGNKNVTLTYQDDQVEYIGDDRFLAEEEIESLMRNVRVIREKYREDISIGKSIIAEWSFAYNTDIEHQPMGDKYLVFYELRSIL